MTLGYKRDIAVGAAWGRMVKMGIAPQTQSATDAYRVLGDMAVTDRGLIASQWYWTASEAQYKLFIKDWNKRKVARK